MNETLYEINWHAINGVFSNATVTPITVVRRGILPGCSAPTITFIDSDGVRCNASPDYYYETEDAAWDAARRMLEEALEANCQQLAAIEADVMGMRAVLKKLIDKNPV